MTTLNGERNLKEDIEDIAEKCLSSTAVMCKTIFPSLFEYEWSESHKQVCKLLDDDSIQQLAIAAWRGFGKTSLVQLGYMARRLAARDKHYIVTVSESSKLAITQSENLKRELMRNIEFGQIFGNMRSKDSFSKEEWIANNPTSDCPGGTMVLPRGCGQQVRGILYDGHRPDLIVIDDLEDRKRIMSPDYNKEVREFFHQDLLNCIDRTRKGNRIIIIGTVLSEGSLLHGLIKSPHWTSVRLELCDDEFHSNWPERWTDEGIKALYDEFVESYLEDAFYREFRNLPQSTKNKPIMREHFKYYDSCPDYAVKVVLIDPAKTTTDKSCDTAIVVGAVDVITGRVFVLDLVSSKLHPDEMHQQAYDLCRKYSTPFLGIEVTGLNEHVLWPLQNFIRQQSAPVQVTPLHARKGPSVYSLGGGAGKGKPARIGSSLVPLYRQGLVYHPKDHPLLQRFESQLLAFPYGDDVDMIDAFSYIVQFMHGGDMYMSGEMPTEKEEEDWDELLKMSAKSEDRALAKLYGRSFDNEH